MSAPFISGLLALMLSYHRNGGDHETPLTHYMEAIAHLQAFQAGILVSGLNKNFGVGITNVAPILAKVKTTQVLTQTAAVLPTWRMKLYSGIDKMIRRVVLGPTE
jgi:hypothetical protein